MSTHPSSPRFALFPQQTDADGEGKRPTVRRYSLARVHGTPRQSGESGRYSYLKRTHD